MTDPPAGAAPLAPAVDRPAGRGAPVGWTAVALGSAVLAAGATGGLAAGLPVALGATLTRGAMDVAAVTCTGVVLLALMAPGHPAGAAGAVLRGTATAWLGFGLLDLVLRTALVTGEPVTQVQPADLVAFVTGPAAGVGLVVGTTAAAFVLGCSLAAPLSTGHGSGPAVLTLLITLVGVAVPAATGHAAGAGSPPQIVAILLHAPAAALWVGGLGALLVVARRDVLDVALPRFSRLAGSCIAVLAVTGVVGATARIEAWSELASPYGALVLAKVGCLAAAGALGGLTRRRLRADRTPILVWAGVEVLVLAVAVGLAATLTQTA